MTRRFEKPTQIKRPFEFHLKIGLAFGFISTVFLFFAVLALLPGFPPISKYISLKFAKFFAISNSRLNSYLVQVDAYFHTFEILIACLAVGFILAITFTVISRRNQKRLVINRGGQIDSLAAAKKLGAMQ